MRYNADDVKAGLFLTAFVLCMLWFGYEFGTHLNGRIERKSKLDSLTMENLKLDIELKKHKIKTNQ